MAEERVGPDPLRHPSPTRPTGPAGQTGTTGSPRLTGFRRSDGRVGVRNHVVVLPDDDLPNAGCENVAPTVPGALALPHH